MLEIIFQNSLIIFTLIMALRCFSNFLALPQNMYDAETLDKAQKLFKGKEGEELWKKENYFSSTQNKFEFTLLIILIIASFIFNDLKNLISSIIFLFVFMAIIYPFLPRDRVSGKEYYGYTIKAWILFISAIILSILSSSGYLYLYT